MRDLRRTLNRGLLLGAVLAAAGCARPEGSAPAVAVRADSGFAALQERGRQAMGVDQYTSTHFFDALPDGGRIELQRDLDDPAGVRQIRRHLQEIAAAFEAGDFSGPAFIHMREVPGAAVMAEKRGAITYTYRELPRGGELRITTADPEALGAIHEFMAFQRQDHHAGGILPGGSDPGEGGAHQGGMHRGGAGRGAGGHDHDAMRGQRQGGAMGMGMGSGMDAGRGDPAFGADMALVHELLVNNQAIRRTVTNLPNGIRTVTESDDPRVAGFIVAHVESMDARLKEGALFNLFSTTLPVIFENRDRIRTRLERTATGVALTQTSEDPAVVAALQAHAEEVSELVREGMVAMMRGMMESGRGMGGMHGGAPMP